MNATVAKMLAGLAMMLDAVHVDDDIQDAIEESMEGLTMTHTHCTNCRRRIPYGEPPFTTLCITERKVCHDCKPQTRGRIA